MTDNEIDHGAPATSENDTRRPKRGLMSGLKAIAKRVTNSWYRSPQIETKQQPVAASIKSEHADQVTQASVKSEQNKKQLRETIQTLDEKQAARKEAAAVEIVNASIKLEYDDQIPQAYVKSEQNQERLRRQLREKMRALDKKGESQLSGTITYKGVSSLKRGATLHTKISGVRTPTAKTLSSMDALGCSSGSKSSVSTNALPIKDGLPLPSQMDVHQKAQALSVKSIKAEMVDIPPSKNPRPSRSASSSTLNSTTSSVFSRASTSSASTSASSISDEPSPVNAHRTAQAISMRSVKANMVDISPSTAKKEVIGRPTLADLSRAEDHQTQRPQLNPRVRSTGLGR